MKRGSIMFWFIPCRMKVPGMYGFQMSGAGMLTLLGTTRISLRATVPPVLAPPAAAGAFPGAAAGAAQLDSTTAKTLMTAIAFKRPILTLDIFTLHGS